MQVENFCDIKKKIWKYKYLENQPWFFDGIKKFIIHCKYVTFD